MAKYFSVTIDELLSGEEVLTIAEEDHKKRGMQVRDLVFGLLDCSVAMCFFLPFFRQRTGGTLYGVSLLSLHEIQLYLKVSYCAVFAALIALGILTLALQNCHQAFWVKNKHKISVALNAAGMLLCIISLQPYAAVFLFVFLTIKVFMLAKRP